jgi:lactate permease
VFHQLLAPVGDSLGLSFIAAMLPVLTVLILLGLLRRPGWQAALAGLIVGLVVAIGLWRMPAGLALNSIAAGAVFAFLPVMWIVLNALLLYNIAVESGRFDAFRAWIINHVPNDRRVVLVVIGFCFGCLLEGISGFGTPVAITSSLLILVGFPALEALVFVLIFNTAPVAFGALGTPVTVLGAVTNLPAHTLGAMVGRQLPVIALLLPFYVIALYGGLRSLKALWPLLLVAGASFAVSQFISSNYLDYALTDVFSALGSLVCTLLFLQVWKPAPDAEFAIGDAAEHEATKAQPIAPWQGWIPWLIVSAVVIIWTRFNVALVGQKKIPWPGLDKAIAITLYNGKPYAAIWTFQPLGTGTAILIAAIITALVIGLSPRNFVTCIGHTIRQAWIAVVTVMLILGLAYLMNYSGMAYSLGKAVASTGALFVLLSPFLGWVAVLLSGSDTSGNALFGNLQVVAARQLNLNPILFAATNSSGGVLGKMVSPQNIATGVAVTKLKGQEGVVFARTFGHSIILTIVLGVLVAIQQYLIPGIIPVTH